MAKKRERIAVWADDPAPHDFEAAGDFLSLLFSDAVSAAAVEALRSTSAVQRKAKDLMRASLLPLLPVDDPEVAKDLKRIAKGDLLSPVLLVRGQGTAGVPLIVADGYHRICAGYHLHEDADIPCRIADAVASPRKPRQPRPKSLGA